MEKCFVIHGIKELSDISSPEIAIAIPLEKILCTLNRGKQTLPLTARPYVKDEGLVVDCDQMIVEKPVDEAVPDARDDDLPSLRIVHAKGQIRTVPICSVTQFTVQFREVLLKMKAKMLQFWRVFLPSDESKPAMPESGYTEINGHAAHHQPDVRSVQASCRYFRESKQTLALLTWQERGRHCPQPPLRIDHGEECAKAAESGLPHQSMCSPGNMHAQTTTLFGAQACKRNENLPNAGNRGRRGTADRRMVKVVTKLMNP